MQDKMAAPNKVTDTRTELAELIKKRAEIAVSCRQTVKLVLMINLYASLLIFCSLFASIIRKMLDRYIMTSERYGRQKLHTFTGFIVKNVLKSDQHLHMM